MRLLWLGWTIREELERAIALDPDLVEARLDLVRFHTMAPRIAGAKKEKAKEEAVEVGKRNAALGAFAHGYIAYREKLFGPARTKFREAAGGAASIEHRVMALVWLGWLSQESQQYDDAFEAFETVLALEPSHHAALYEIGRTAVFAGRDLERGERALRAFLKRAPDANGHLQLALLLEKKGDRSGARAEAEKALRLDRRLSEARAIVKRLTPARAPAPH